jgi:hypothetical protein
MRLLAVSIAMASLVAVATPLLAGPGAHGGGPGGGGPPAGVGPSGAFPSKGADHDVKGNRGKHEGTKRGNKGGKVRGLNRADQVAGEHGDQGRDNARTKQSR